mmetsp:Transcript_31599/g.55837  ORF Transcript_31599/g.55837 Transcript_31599/m.55837 type:complete len:252 (+) Transcript_31599:65-820(+)
MSIMQAGTDANARNAYGQTPLHLAVLSNSFAELQKLLNLGANVHSEDNQFSTALHVAAKMGRTEMVKMLAERGADVNAIAKLGYRPLHEAVEAGHTDTMETLVSLRADLNAAASCGTTPLHMCYKKPEMAKAVAIAMGLKADLEVKDDFGKTPGERGVQLNVEDLPKWVLTLTPSSDASGHMTVSFTNILTGSEAAVLPARDTEALRTVKSALLDKLGLPKSAMERLRLARPDGQAFDKTDDFKTLAELLN